MLRAWLRWRFLVDHPDDGACVQVVLNGRGGTTWWAQSAEFWRECDRCDPSVRADPSPHGRMIRPC